MAQLQWLAAALSPSDIAPHPNFFSTESITEPSVLALVCSMRWRDMQRAVESAPDLDLTAVNLAKDALVSETSRQAADRITIFVQSQLAENDLGKLSALALIGSVAYCELDMYESAFNLLDSVITQLADDNLPDYKLLLAALYQQLAMRNYDYNSDDIYPELARKAKAYLDDLDVNSLSAFELSQGVSWTSSTTLRDIIDVLDVAAQSLIMSASVPFAEGWQELVRRRPGYLDVRALRNTADAYESFVDDLFEARVPSNTEIFGKVSPDSYLFSALLNEELSGRPSARSTRSHLGTLRFLQGSDMKEEWLLSQAINLLRQGRDYRRLRSAVGFIRNSGPLRALSVSAGQIMTERPSTSFGLGELIVLRSAVDLLDSRIAHLYFARIVGIFADPESVRLRDLTFYEEAMLAAAEFANVTLTPTGFAAIMLAMAKRLPQSEPYQMAVARALNVFDFSLATSEERAEWSSWLTEQTVSGPVVSTVSVKLDSAVAPYSDGTLESVAYHVDRWLHNKTAMPDAVAQAAPAILVTRLREIKEDAHRGVFSFVAIDAAAAAVVAARLTGSADLWSELAYFISDTAIQRSDTQNAFELLSDEPFSVPQVIRTQLATRITPLLYTTQSMFESQSVSPYPSALKCFISLKLVEFPAAIVEISALAGSVIEQARSAACSVLSTYATHVDRRSTWVSVLALQLSKDQSATVRARAGRTLATLLAANNELGSLLLTRVEALLGEDGLVVPINLLRELANSASTLDPRLMSRIRQLSSGSVSDYIRRAASGILARDSD